MKNLLKQRFCILSILLISIIFCTNLQARTIYVDSSNVSGTYNGLTWATAFNDFGNGVNAATNGDVVYVAKGTYQPASGASFGMKTGVEIYGGFSATDTTFALRDWITNVTVLRGNGNSVISNSGLNPTAILDGFTITGGNGTAGGMYNNGRSSPTLTNVIFSNNTATGSGGGMNNNGFSSPKLMNVIFSNNTTTSGNGGGMSNNGHSSPTLTNVIFSNNTTTSGNGGGMYNNGASDAKLTNVIFSNNTTTYDGGGMNNNSSDPILTNVIFSNNTTTSGNGGGMYNNFSDPTLTNVTFSNNTTTYFFSPGGGMSNNFSDPVVSNTVFWGNTTDIGGTGTTITFSYTQSNISGSGNILGTINPFVDDANPKGLDSTWMTADDGLQLICNAPPVNAGRNDSIPGIILAFATDITGTNRVIDSIVDMGAYERRTTITNRSSTIKVNACSNYTWEGTNYTASGTYIDTIPNTVGCDSIKTLHLTINKSDSSSQTTAACNSYTWQGTNYTSSGTYMDTILNAAGCDSAMTLHLTINTSTTSSQTTTACDSYTWHGTNLTSSGTYMDTIPNAAGCDSVLTLHLTIYSAPTLTLVKVDDNCNSNDGSATAIVTSNNPPISYLWNTGETDSTISNLPVATYSVTVTDSLGCATSGSISLNDSCNSNLVIPNVITPNGDGKNDVFKIAGLSLYPGTKVLIFDRWGREVYKNDDYQNDWDGGDLTDGNYLYIITINNKEQTVHKGNLTILSSENK